MNFWLQIYVYNAIAHILTFIVIKYYFLRDLYLTKENKELKRKYDPFLRRDLDNLSIIWNFPFYQLYLPKLIIGWLLLTILSVFTHIVCFGQDASNLDKNR